MNPDFFRISFFWLFSGFKKRDSKLTPPEEEDEDWMSRAKYMPSSPLMNETTWMSQEVSKRLVNGLVHPNILHL